MDDEDDEQSNDKDHEGGFLSDSSVSVGCGLDMDSEHSDAVDARLFWQAAEDVRNQQTEPENMTGNPTTHHAAITSTVTRTRNDQLESLSYHSEQKEEEMKQKKRSREGSDEVCDDTNITKPSPAAPPTIKAVNIMATSSPFQHTPTASVKVHKPSPPPPSAARSTTDDKSDRLKLTLTTMTTSRTKTTMTQSSPTTKLTRAPGAPKRSRTPFILFSAWKHKQIREETDQANIFLATTNKGKSKKNKVGDDDKTVRSSSSRYGRVVRFLPLCVRSSVSAGRY